MNRKPAYNDFDQIVSSWHTNVNTGCSTFFMQKKWQMTKGLNNDVSSCDWLRQKAIKKTVLSLHWPFTQPERVQGSLVTTLYFVEWPRGSSLEWHSLPFEWYSHDGKVKRTKTRNHNWTKPTNYCSKSINYKQTPINKGIILHCNAKRPECYQQIANATQRAAIIFSL